MTVKAFSYLRFSSIAQADGDSLRRQLKAASDWVADHPGVELDTSIQPDRGVSAFHGDNRVRGAFSAFLQRVDRGDIPAGSYFLIESFDRMTRENETIAINLLTSITLKGVKVVTLADGAVYDERSDAMDLMRAIIVMSRAHEENKQRAARVAAAWAEKKHRARETGEVLSRRGPAWTRFNSDIRKFELIPERAAVVRRMFQMAIDGLGANAIASRFNAEGVAPFGRSNGWHPEYVLTTLHNPRCFGAYQPTVTAKNAPRTSRRPFDGEPIENYYPAVVERSVFNRVQGVIAARNDRGKGRGRRGHEFPNLLIGLARCEDCGGTLGIQNASGKLRKNIALRCHAAARHHQCANTRKYPVEPIERDLMMFIARAKIDEQHEAPNQNALQIRLDELEELKRRVNILLDQVEQGVPFVAERLRERQVQQIAMEKEVAALRASIASGPRKRDDLVEEWLRLDSELRNASGPDLYALRAKMNALLSDRFEWIMPIEDGFYARSRKERFAADEVATIKVHFNWRDVVAEFEVGADTPVNRQALEEQRGPLPEGWDIEAGEGAEDSLPSE